MGWFLFIVFLLIFFFWIGKREKDKEQNKMKRTPTAVKQRDGSGPSISKPPKHEKKGKPTTSSFSGVKKREPTKRDRTKLYESSRELIQQIKKDFQVKSKKTSMIYFKTTIDSEVFSEIREEIKDDKEFMGDNFVLDSEYYDRVAENVLYDIEVEIDTLAEFINNPHFKKHEKFGRYYGYGYDIEEVYDDLSENSKLKSSLDFAEGVYEILAKDGIIEVRKPTSEESKNYLSYYTVNELKEILAKKGLPVSGKKADLVERVLEHNLIEIPNIVVDGSKANIEDFIKSIAEAYCDELLTQIRALHPLLKKLLIEEALAENSQYEAYMTECLQYRGR